MRPQCSAALRPRSDAQESWILRNPGCSGCTAVLFCQTRRAGQPSAWLDWYQGCVPVHCFPHIPRPCGCQHCSPVEVCWGLFERPSLLSLRLNSSQGKAPDNNTPGENFVCPLLATHSSLLSHRHGLQAAPKPCLMSPGPKVLKCHPASLLAPHRWREPL